MAILASKAIILQLKKNQTNMDLTWEETIFRFHTWMDFDRKDNYKDDL